MTTHAPVLFFANDAEISSTWAFHVRAAINPLYRLFTLWTLLESDFFQPFVKQNQLLCNRHNFFPWSFLFELFAANTLVVCVVWCLTIKAEPNIAFRTCNNRMFRVDLECIATVRCKTILSSFRLCQKETQRNVIVGCLLFWCHKSSELFLSQWLFTSAFGTHEVWTLYLQLTFSNLITYPFWQAWFADFAFTGKFLF